MNINNSYKLTIEEIGVIIEERPSFGIFMWGPPGIGKTSKAYEIAKKRDVPILYFPLAGTDPVDVKGGGYIIDEKGKKVLDWITPRRFFQYEDYILFFDDLTLAVDALQGTIYEIVCERSVRGNPLPKGCQIIGASNRQIDNPASYELQRPLRSRWTQYTVKADLPCWLKWAIQNNIHADIRGFVQFRENYFSPEEINGDAYPCPRTWANVNDHLGKGYASNERLLGASVVGSVGEEAGQEFMKYRKLGPEKIMKVLKEIISGKYPKLPLDMQCAVNSYLVSKYEADIGDCQLASAVMKYAIKLSSDGDVELAKVLISQCIEIAPKFPDRDKKNFAKLLENKNFKEFMVYTH